MSDRWTQILPPVPPEPAQTGILIQQLNKAALLAQDDTLFPDGTITRVKTYRDSFRLDKSGEQPVTPDTIFPTFSTIGRWIREQIPDPTWLDQGTIYIDAIAGNNENLGELSSAPLQTHAEFKRRVQSGLFKKNVFVNLLSDLPADDPIELSASVISDRAIKYSGRLIQVRQGTLTVGSTVANKGAQVFYIVEDTGVTSWGNDVGSLVVIVGGPNGGNFFVVEKSLGNNSKARVSRPVGNTGSFAPGDKYVVYNMTKAYLGQMFLNGDQSNGLALFNNIWFKNPVLNGQDSPIVGTAPTTFTGCRFDAMIQAGSITKPAKFVGCYLAGGINAPAGSRAILEQCAVKVAATVGPGGQLSADKDTLFGQCQVIIDGGNLTIGTAAVFDSPISGVVVKGGGKVRLTNLADGNHLLWGKDNNGVGVQAMAVSDLIYDQTPPTIEGTGGHYSLGGRTTLSVFNGGNGSFYGPVTCTWPNLIAVPPTGFNQAAIDPLTHARIMKSL